MDELRLQLKRFEAEFRDAHNDRLPTREEVKAMPEICKNHKTTHTALVASLSASRRRAASFLTVIRTHPVV